jgi:hypothetical protein
VIGIDALIHANVDSDEDDSDKYDFSKDTNIQSEECKGADYTSFDSKEDDVPHSQSWLSSRPLKPAEKKQKLEDTDASTYFGTSNKINRVAAPPRKQQTKKKQDDDFMIDDDDFEFDEDLMEEIETPVPTKTSNGVKKEKNETPKTSPVKAAPVKIVTPVKTAAPAKTTAVLKENIKTAPAKRKVQVLSSGDEDDFVDPKPAPKTTRSTPKKAPTDTIKNIPATKTPTKAVAKSAPKSSVKTEPKTATKPAPKPKKAEIKDTEDPERKAILESIETVALPDTDPATDTKYPPPSSTNIDSISAQWQVDLALKPKEAKNFPSETKNV